MATVYVVFCTSDGCDECGGSSSHVLGVTHDQGTADLFASNHDADEKAHYGHHHYTEVIPMELSAPAEWHATQSVML